MTAETERAAVSVELERLRGSVDTGFATLNGRLDVVLQRTGQVEADVAALAQRHDADVSELRQQVEELRRRVWAAGGGLVVVSAVGSYAMQMLPS